jgi:hypothetical protein
LAKRLQIHRKCHWILLCGLPTGKCYTCCLKKWMNDDFLFLIAD